MFDKAAAAFERLNTGRLTQQQIIDAMHLGTAAFYSDRATDAKKKYLRTAGKALMQLWHDLEEQERKVLA